jgi:hypothetical protein
MIFCFTVLFGVAIIGIEGVQLLTAVLFMMSGLFFEGSMTALTSTHIGDAN